MKLDHIALYVDDLEAMKSFYTRHFGASANEQYRDRRTGLRTYFLSFEGGARLEIMQRSEVSPRASSGNTLGFTHISFKLGSQEKVDQLTTRLQEVGCPLLNGPRVTGDGYYESVLTDPEGNQIELVA